MHPRLVQLIALLVCGGLLYGSARLVPAINEGRRHLNMYGSPDVLANAPPEYAFAIQAFGAFRSLIVNLAFIRAETAKEAGRYYDALQLASWICTLQPRFPAVWSFHAWNMAWNISVTTFTAQERWNWVYNGVKLLRDQGLRYNPRAVNLYKDLAWIFNNKMSEILDDFHWDYKRAWAWRMHLLLGPPPSAIGEYRPGEQFQPVVFDVANDPLLEAARVTAAQNEEKRRRNAAEQGLIYQTRKSVAELYAELPRAGPRDALTPAEMAQRAVYDFSVAIDQAPRTLDELYAQQPETRQMVAQLREFGVIITDEVLDEDTYWYDGKLAATFFARYRELVDTPSLRNPDASAEKRQILERFDAILGARERRPAGLALLRFLQRRVLSEVYKLEPQRMAELIRNFGAVDWRVVDAQSLYWIARGLEMGGETLSTFENDKVNTARILFFSLRNLFERNRLRFEPNPTDVFKSYINFTPDLNFIEPMHRAFITYGPMMDPDPGNTGGAGETFRAGHITFLMQAIRMLFFAERLAEAERYYEFLRMTYARTPGGSLDTRYAQPLRDFVIQTFYPNIDEPKETEALVADLLFQACTDLANEDIEGYNRLVTKALEFHAAYMGPRQKDTGPRMQLLPFQDYQIEVLRTWLALPATSDNELARKARLWLLAPPHLKQWVYDDLSEWLRRECDLWGFDVARAFPEPPEMDAFRTLHPRREATRREPSAETPVQPGR